MKQTVKIEDDPAFTGLLNCKVDRSKLAGKDEKPNVFFKGFQDLETV